MWYISEIHFRLTCEACGEDFHIKTEPACESFEESIREAKQGLTNKGWNLSQAICHECFHRKAQEEAKINEQQYIKSRI